MAVEEIKPYDENSGKAEQVERMFDSIAPSYDFMNHAMTFGLDRCWRDKAISMLKRSLSATAGTLNVLDVACGTGDVTFALAKSLAESHITGIDLSPGMLQRAIDKLQSSHCSGLKDRVAFLEADCLDLPYSDDTFDAVTVAYGVRNFENLLAGYREMRRVLKTGGTICVLELCEPKNRLVRMGYRIYSGGMIPLAGRLISGDRRAYSYLPDSIRRCPARRQMTTLMTDAGFADAAYRVLFPGDAAVYIARKP